MNEISHTLVIVVPTRNEEGNVGPLLKQIADSVPDPKHTCVLFVDDSDDLLTVEAIETARAAVTELTVEYVYRQRDERAGGLASAVKLGMATAASDATIIVMDADLQHPPATILEMLAKAEQTGADLIVASRYCSGGSADGLGKSQEDDLGSAQRLSEYTHRIVRHAVSRLSTLAALILFPRVLRGVTDPMTGFFLVRREAINLELLQASGFKILLELLVTHPQLTRAEVPLQFGARTEGESKGTAAQGLYYLRQLLRLRLST